MYTHLHISTYTTHGLTVEFLYTVVLLDELYDNGKTLQSVKEALYKSEELALEEKDIFTCTLFKKEKDTQASYRLPDLYGMDVPDVWLVGYGLDDCQEKRGWNCLFAIPKIDGIPKGPLDEMFEDTDAGRAVHLATRLVVCVCVCVCVCTHALVCVFDRCV
jgi:hypothetical protein